MKISDILDQIGKDVLAEDTKQSLVEAFEDSVTRRVNERVEAEVTAALQQLDESHAVQLEQLLEAVDKDHVAKLQKVLAKIDEDHTAKLEQLIETHNNAINEDAREFKEGLVKQLSNYIDLYLEDAIPHEQLAEAVENKRAAKILENIKQLVSVDDEYVNQTIREAVSDGKRQIDALRSELNEAVKQNIRMSQRAKTAETQLMLEKNTTNFSKEKKEYVMRVLKNKDPEYITENFNYVVKMFDKEDDQNRETLLQEEVKVKTKASSVESPKSKIREEREVLEESNRRSSNVKEYLQGLK